MIKPNPTQLTTEFNRLKEMNGEGRYASNSFKEIGDQHGYTANNVKNLLLGNIKTWRQHHFAIWKTCQKYKGKAKVVKKYVEVDED